MSKKEAAKAVDELKTYLRRDMRATKLLDTVTRFNGELRQERSRLNDEVASLKSAVESLTRNRLSLETENAELRRQLETESAARRQAESIAAADRKAVDEMASRLNPPPPAEVEVDHVAWWPVFKSLRVRLPVAPRPIKVIPGGEVTPGREHVADRIYVFEIGDFIRKFTVDEFILLGQLVAVGYCAWGGLIAFGSSREEKDGYHLRYLGKQPDKRVGAFVHWIGKTWIKKEPAWRETLHEAGFGRPYESPAIQVK